MTIKTIWLASAALTTLGLVSCISPEPVETGVAEEETKPFIDPLILAQNMCSGRASQASAATLTAAASLNPGFDYGAPFALPAEVTEHFHYPVTTTSADAQLWFDTGLAHMANFNHDEAIAAFRKAQSADPDCAMCYWGEGLSFGSNINIPYMPERGAAGLLATREALTRLDGLTPAETKLIKALDQRYSVVDDAEVVERANEFADAMDKVAVAFPDDKFILSLAAEANMDTQPWDYWKPGAREPKGRTARTLELIENALAIDPDFAPAIHLYIHITESSVDPFRAESYADRLLDQELGVGHLVHMPSHIYLRLGQWKKSHASNISAIQADEAYIAATDNAAVYGSVYYPHNVHFVVASSQFAGDAGTALEMAGKLKAMAVLDPAGPAPLAEHIAASPIFTDLLFSSDETVLDVPEPAAPHLYMRTAWHYARGTVFARQGDLEAAKTELGLLRSLTGADGFADYETQYFAPLPGIHQVAQLTLEGRLQAAQGDLNAAIDSLESAAAAEAQLPYFEPTWWYYPTRQTLGMLLLRDGQYDRAEREFYKTLIKAPNNAYALYGLAETFRAKGDARSEAYARELFRDAWMGGDDTAPDLMDL
ncbi:MAG: tetratricopeptide repeat protein [Hyphomonadaceae bacterium]|nr:tetratricopeptide repeat protein [Hyphomonadaceae bacterium]